MIGETPAVRQWLERRGWKRYCVPVNGAAVLWGYKDSTTLHPLDLAIDLQIQAETEDAGCME